MKIKDLKIGDKKVNIKVQVKRIGETREFERTGSKNRMATAIVEDESEEIDMPLFNDELDIVKEGDLIEVINGYVSEFNGIKQLRAGKYGKIEIVNPVEGKKDLKKVLKKKEAKEKIIIKKRL